MHPEINLSNPLLYSGKKAEIRAARSGAAAALKEENSIIRDGEKSTPVNWRRKESNSRVHMWIRSMHLCSGLFILTWVLLHGFTGLQFSHSTEMADLNTESANLSLADERTHYLPSTEKMTPQAIAQTIQKLRSGERDQACEFAAKPNVFSNRQVTGLPGSKGISVTVIPNRDDRKSHLKSRTSTLINEQGTNEKVAAVAKAVSIEDGFDLPLETDPIGYFNPSLIKPRQAYALKATERNSRNMPIRALAGTVDGKPVQLLSTWTGGLSTNLIKTQSKTPFRE